MASSIDIFNQYPLHLDPTSKAISLEPSSSQSAQQTASINEELKSLNLLHRSLLALDSPNVPPPPLPINPKRSAQITKLRDSANTAYRKNNHVEAIKLYTYAIDMALGRPGWEPVTLARDELSGLYANRAQAHMAQQNWPEAMLDAKTSVESKHVGNVKAWWRAAKCLAEMTRWQEAKTLLERGLETEGRNSEGGKELMSLLEEVEEGLKRSA
ncbi:hypothetical protein EYZ11_005766 [Aspergillus tanneri]|uniref:Translocation protein sec72 n=1 Tax=Aspergillus tanneri TaxID=1220188 RepID=A0A4V3UPE6_9EURO|nr:uncharacterized protein ATNIH1004_006393 [Aspergillus tanneri]KAA8647698.1 hypothetical protein ATNIH1004_006393 [Aspergillus tanneri]THC94774.1 hypothetical protein EYZ11_005766 [Aspergillus tanneri]